MSAELGWLGLSEAKPRSLGRRTNRGFAPKGSGFNPSQPEIADSRQLSL